MDTSCCSYHYDISYKLQQKEYNSKKNRRIEEIDIWRDKYQNDAYLESYLTENFKQNQLKKFVYINMNIV